MTDLTTRSQLPAHLLDLAAGYAAQAVSLNTARAYSADWAHYQGWCSEHGLQALPAAPEVVGAFLAAHASTLSVATLERRLAAISAAHRQAGHQLDTKHMGIRAVFGGIKRQHGTAQRKVKAADADVMRALLSTCGSDLLGLRDRAVLRLGFAGALRRSEIVALEVGDLEFVPQGVRVHIRRSKGDQEAAGAVVAIQDVAVAEALQAWLSAAKIASGAVFRSLDRGRVGTGMIRTATVAEMIKKRCEFAGLDATDISAHSLRAGGITEMAAQGAATHDIQAVSRHRDLRVLGGYIRHGSEWTNNPTKLLGLD